MHAILFVCISVLPHAGECMLERDSDSKSDVPLLKDMFASERRKAKVLNFSIAYGKTAHGLSRDWKVSLEEATSTVEKWYADRPEVRLYSRRLCSILVVTALQYLLSSSATVQ